MQRFADKVVVVTGAGSGIGKATAERFLDEGAVVTLVGRTRSKLEEVAKPFRDDQFMIAETDVSNEGEVKELISRTVEKFGRLDVLVNNAGVVAEGDVGTLTTDDWRRVMATDVDGVFYASRAAIPHLKTSRGSIVNVSSVSGIGRLQRRQGCSDQSYAGYGYGPRERRRQGQCSVPEPDTDRHDRGHDGRRQADCEVQRTVRA